jgi:hypothetical protein
MVQTKHKTDFEEVIAYCKICGKKIKFVKRKGRTIESLVCQKCGKW